LRGLIFHQKTRQQNDGISLKMRMFVN
jgi:hypothetical protein